MGRTEKVADEGAIASVLAKQRSAAQAVDSARLALEALEAKWTAEVVRRWGPEALLDIKKLSVEEADIHQAYSTVLMRIGSVLLVTNAALHAKDVQDFYAQADDHLHEFIGSAQDKLEYTRNNQTANTFLDTMHILYGEILKALVDFT